MLDRTQELAQQAAEADSASHDAAAQASAAACVGVVRGFWQFFLTQGFSSLTRRIILLNIAGLLALVIGILYLSQFRAGLIDARVRSLQVQADIIAGAIAASATVETDSITIDPDKLLELQTGDSYGPADDVALGAGIPDQSGTRRAGAAPPDHADQYARAHL